MILKTKQKGSVLLPTLLFSAIAVILISGLTNGVGINLKSSTRAVEREQALQIAEAGIDYYRWHLAHAPTDFQDGTGGPGPYFHEVKDKNGDLIGQFSLNITPPSEGSTLVVIESTGTSTANPVVSRTIRTELAKPSFAKYAVVANDFMRFGEGTEVFGPIHSNKGIRFDGLAHNLISSLQETYDDPDHGGANEFAVHTHVNPVDPLPPSPPVTHEDAPSRPDVFEVGRQFPSPPVDFVGVTQDLSLIKTDAQSDGLYFPDSGRLGYEVVLKTDDTFDLYKVRTIANPPSSCSWGMDTDTWGTWSVNQTISMGNYAFPSNGLLFFEDDVWVRGQIDTARLTIASGKFPDSPTTRTNVLVNQDILYTNYDGSDVISLIAQNNVLTGLYSEDDLRIDAALIAQNGKVGREYYQGPFRWWFWNLNGCSPYHERDKVTLYGMIGTHDRYGYAYTDGTGYDIREINYDANLLYGPPPSFPLTSDHYEVLSWEEVE